VENNKNMVTSDNDQSQQEISEVLLVHVAKRKKKRKRIIIIVASVALFVMIGIGVGIFFLVSTLFPARIPLSANEFTIIMEEKGFEVVDITEESELYEDIVKLMLRVDDSQFLMGFWKFFTNEDAQRVFFNTRQNAIHDLIGGFESYSEVNLPNFNRYTRRAGGHFVVLSRIDNTYIFISTNEEDREIANSIMSELGY